MTEPDGTRKLYQVFEREMPLDLSYYCCEVDGELVLMSCKWGGGVDLEGDKVRKWGTGMDERGVG